MAQQENSIEDLIQHIAQAYESLPKQLKSIATKLPKWCNDEVCREVQRRCSLSESEMEMYWSRRIVSSVCPQQELEKFWYIDNYRELVRREVGLLGGSGLSLTDSSRAAMIGSGPPAFDRLVFVASDGHGG